MFTYAHVKWFYGQSEHAYYLNYFIKWYLASVFKHFINSIAFHNVFFVSAVVL